MLASLAPRQPAIPPSGALDDVPPSFLTASGPRVVIGGEIDADGLAKSIVPGPASLFGPRGACLAGPEGPLFVCDTGHHRLLIWSRTPQADDAPADVLIGQPDFSREGRNAKGEVGATTLNVPTGVAAVDGVLAVADAWNHRVLIWHGYPEASNRPADVVLGQADFSGGQANRGGTAAGPDTLNWCYGVAIVEGRLVVADTGNRRVMVWHGIPRRNGQGADLVLGQQDFITRDDNGGEDTGAAGMRWPHGIAMVDGVILISDAGNNRVMAWRGWPNANGAPCDFVLGQASVAANDHNRAAYHPTAGAMNMPYGLSVLGSRLIVADTANSRLVGYDIGALANGAVATTLVAQKSFADKGDNRWKAAARDSLCWPYAADACEGTLVIADTGNNRVLLWNAAP